MDWLYFFGGYQRKRGTYYNDLFYFDLDKKSWATIAPNYTTSPEDVPSPRTDHSVVIFDGSMYVFGGYDGVARFNDLHRCKLRDGKFKWRQINAEGTVPLNRFGHAAVVVRNSMFVIGGWNGHDTMDDIYQYSFLSNLWFEIRRIKGVRPKPRYRHSAVAHKNQIIIFGGVDTNQKRFNDLFIYDCDTRLWGEQSTTGQAPQQRTFHKAVIADHVMYVVGGFDGSRLNDMYHVALEKGRDDSDDAISVSGSHRVLRTPTSAASGIMQTVPSDLSVH